MWRRFGTLTKYSEMVLPLFWFLVAWQQSYSRCYNIADGRRCLAECYWFWFRATGRCVEVWQTVTPPKPDDRCLVRVQLQSVRGAPPGNVRGTDGRTVSDRLGVDNCAAVIELCHQHIRESGPCAFQTRLWGPWSLRWNQEIRKRSPGTGVRCARPENNLRHYRHIRVTRVRSLR